MADATLTGISDWDAGMLSVVTAVVVSLAYKPREVASRVGSACWAVSTCADCRTVGSRPKVVRCRDLVASSTLATFNGPRAGAEAAHTRLSTHTGARHVGHRGHGHTVAAVRRPPRPPSNATPEGRLAAHLARARHVVVLHSMDGCVVRTLGSGSRCPLDFDVIIIVAASRAGCLQPPPGDGINHGFVYAMTPVRVTFTTGLAIGGPRPQIKACGHGISSRVILQHALSPPEGCLRILLRPCPRPYESRTCFSGADRLRSSLLSL